MAYDFLMNTASALFFICYIPELYANWKNKNANFYNMPEKALLLLASSFALAYAIINSDISLMSNYGRKDGKTICKKRNTYRKQKLYS